MKKFMKKAVKVLCLVLVMAMVISPLALANPFETVQPNTGSDVATKVNELGGEIAGIIQVIGYVVAVIMVVWVGVQYMIATPSKKAELKGKLWSMAIGAVLIVCGVTILGVVADAGKTIVEVAK